MHISECACVCLHAHVPYVCAPSLERKHEIGSFSFRSNMNKQCLILLCFEEYDLVLH